MVKTDSQLQELTVSVSEGFPYDKAEDIVESFERSIRDGMFEIIHDTIDMGFNCIGHLSIIRRIFKQLSKYRRSNCIKNRDVNKAKRRKQKSRK